jgi:hypothetical protein
MSRFLHFTVSASKIPEWHISTEPPSEPYLEISIDEIWKLACKLDEIYVKLTYEGQKVTRLTICSLDTEWNHQKEILVALSDVFKERSGDLPTQPLDDDE